MSVTVNINQPQSYYSNQMQSPICQGPVGFQPTSPLGRPRSSMGRMIGGLVGAIVGQMLCPIPFVGAMLGGMIGSIFGGMLDNLFAGSRPCCCHNMQQNYGPHNANMGFNYGYPIDMPYLPQNFPNPDFGSCPPMFPNGQPPVADYNLPQVGLLPFYNRQHQHHHDETTQRSQISVLGVGKNDQLSENVHGHNQGRQVAVAVAGVNEQAQVNVTGNNEGTQVAVTPVGVNRQRQTNVHGDNSGTQVAVNVVGNNTQTQETVTGDNSGTQRATTTVGNNTQTQTTAQGDNTGTQTATTVLGSNTQVKETVEGDNTGAQTAVTLAGVNEQTQATRVGDNTGDQTAVNVAGPNTQTQSTVVGDNEGDQTAVTLGGTQTQTQVTQQGDNTGDQRAVSLVGGETQTQSTVVGDNNGDQRATNAVGEQTQIQSTVVGDNTGDQTAASVVADQTQAEVTQQGDNTGDQTASTVIGDQTQLQETVVGDNAGDQSAVTSIGDQTQTQTTVHGDNTGDQTARTEIGDVSQVTDTHTGENTGTQQAETVLGDTSQTSHSGEANTTTQTADTVIGDAAQVASGGDGSVITQDAETGLGDVVQAAAAGEASVVDQRADAGGTVIQEATVDSGVIEQQGGNQQTAASGGGPVVVNQTGDRHGEAVQQARGSDAGDVISQQAGQGTLSLFDDNSTASVDLGGGNDVYTYQGNSEMNHVRVEGGGAQTGPDRDTVRINTEGGSDTAVINLSNGRDNYDINLGRGNDRLVINEQGQRVRIMDNQGREIYRSEGWTEADGTARVDGMENLSVYREDGSFARWDRRNGLTEGRDAGRPGEMTPVRAARLLREHAGTLDTSNGTGSVDGVIGRPDLASALNNPSTPPELREAIQYTLGNESVWRAMDASGAGGNRVNLEGLNNFIDGYETRPSYNPDAPMSDRQAASVLNYHSSLLDTASGGGQNGKFNEDDLRAIASGQNPSLPPELRAAAGRLLGSSSFAERVDDVSYEMGGFGGGRTFSNDDLAGYR